jgi:DNA-binding MarR family transcriptional regulator
LLASRALRELEVVGATVERLVAALARRHGLSHAALNALAVIEGHGAALPAGEVAERMHITTGTTTSLIDTLERKQYVRRLLDPGDRRRVLVDITPEAQDLLDELLPEVQQLAVAMMAPLGEQRLHDLLALIDDVRTAAGAVPDELPHATRRRPRHLDRTRAR